jgi:hypothetical protein
MGGDYSKIGSPNDVSVLNPQEQQLRQSALQGGFSSASGYNNILSQLGSLTNGGGMNVRWNPASAYQVNAPQAVSAQNIQSAYNPLAANNAFLAQNPQLQELAHQQASQSLDPTRQSAEQLAALQSQNAIRSTSDQLAKAGLLNSGAANQSLLEASLTPQQQMQTQLSQLQATQEGQNYNNILGIAGNQLLQGYGQAGQQEFQANTANAGNALQAALSNAQNQLQAGSTNAQLGTQTSLANSQGQLSADQQTIANLLNSLGLQGQLTGQQASIYDALANATQQQYWQPQYQKNPGLFDYLSLAPPMINALKWPSVPPTQPKIP